MDGNNPKWAELVTWKEEQQNISTYQIIPACFEGWDHFEQW